MSLRFRLITLLCLALVVSLAMGGITAWVNATRRVQPEMPAALVVARKTIDIAVERLLQGPALSRHLDELVASFGGTRHLRVRFIGEAPAATAPIVKKPPFGAVPDWF